MVLNSTFADSDSDDMDDDDDEEDTEDPEVLKQISGFQEEISQNPYNSGSSLHLAR